MKKLHELSKNSCYNCILYFLRYVQNKSLSLSDTTTKRKGNK